MWQCYIQAKREDLEIFYHYLADQFISSSLFEIDEKENVWAMDGLFPEESLQIEIRTRLEILSKTYHLTSPTITFEKLPDKDWVRENRASFEPIQVGQFYIHSSYDHSRPEGSDKILLEIDASLAFGTGQHETTKGCLIALENLSKTYTFKKALDLGTGSGILAMAIAALYHCPTLAVDIDPDAIDIAQANIEKNGYKPWVDCHISDGFKSACFENAKLFDLIVANILAGPLIELCMEVTAHLESGGLLILSGLLKEQSHDVLEAYKTQGLRFLENKTLGQWVILTLQKT